jgi:hypothetical protein
MLGMPQLKTKFINIEKLFKTTLCRLFYLLFLNPDYALGIVMRVESTIKQTLFQLKHSNRYDEGEKVAKRCVLKRFQHVIDFLMHNLG